MLRHIPYGSERLYETDVADMAEHAASPSRPADGGAAAEKYGAALSPDGRTGLVREGEENPTLRLVGLADGKAIGDPVPQGTAEGPVFEHLAALSDGGKVLAYADGEGGGDQELRRAIAVRDMAAGKELLRIPVTQEEQVEHLAVAPDGRHLAATFAPAAASGQPTAPPSRSGTCARAANSANSPPTTATAPSAPTAAPCSPPPGTPWTSPQDRSGRTSSAGAATPTWSSPRTANRWPS
ncbi:hypothetical protein ACFQVA_07455 [Actinomadura keratinilytica]